MANLFKKLFGKEKKALETAPINENNASNKTTETLTDSVPVYVKTDDANDHEQKVDPHVFTKEEIKEALETKPTEENVSFTEEPTKEESEHVFSKEEISELLESVPEEIVDSVIKEHEKELNNIPNENDITTIVPKENEEEITKRILTKTPSWEEVKFDKENNSEDGEEAPHVKAECVENDVNQPKPQPQKHYPKLGAEFVAAVQEAEETVLGESNTFAQACCGEKEKNLFEFIMRLLVLSPEYRKEVQENAIHEFIIKCDEIRNNIHLYDTLDESDPAAECWAKFSSIETETERKYIAMNLLTSLKWFRNKMLKDELKQNMAKHKERTQHKKEE